MKVIHVAGTNGKGSVCAFLASMLTRAGKKTGLFTSPHLVEITERIVIQGRPGGSGRPLRGPSRRVKRAVDEMEKDGFYHPAYFELLFGSRTASVPEKPGWNIWCWRPDLAAGWMPPTWWSVRLVTVLTTIGMDHMEYLGRHHWRRSPGEKAGILKEGVPVVYDARNEADSRGHPAGGQKEACPSVPLRFASMWRICSGKRIKALILF